MQVFHGSLEIVKMPQILKPNRTLDFGSGFYVTTSYKQAEDWVYRKLDESKQKIGFVNEYFLDENLLKQFSMLEFDSPTDEWIDFVMKNRMNKNFSHNYEVVFGPVANDRVYASFSLFESGLITKKTLIENLKVYKLVDQFLFHTEKSLFCISFIDAKQISKIRK